MIEKFKEYKGLDLSAINKEINRKWAEEKTFEKSIKTREGNKQFIFHEGPPSANGMPGIHHVMARTIKDVFCRYKTLKGFKVERKAGWDTHGLPVELGVEKLLGITKEEIGTKISIEDYNKACRKEVMKYTDAWEDLTNRMGYWIDMNEPYITYDNKYIETLWHLLKELYNKGLLYKGYTIQPFSPAAGTGLSSHELNQPGCYKDVKDTTMTAQFKIVKDEKSQFIFDSETSEVSFLAWTTTPWTLPSNTALAVGAEIEYVKVKTYNPYTNVPVTIILGKPLLNNYFPVADADLNYDDYKAGDKKIPYKVLATYKGKDFKGIKYEQLINWVRPLEFQNGNEDAFNVLLGDFVTTEDGTGIVHIAPTFGADDARVGRENKVPPLQIIDKSGTLQPMVDRQGRLFRIQEMSEDFVKSNINVDEYKDFTGRYVKNAYDESLTENDATLDVDISVYLKKANKAFRIEKHVHNYPHCWRTDKPILYYPLDSWFIKTTAVKDRMIALNKTINWKPESTGTGRFGMWLENLLDWNLSRSRYWGTPLPIWVSEDKSEIKCIGSVEELYNEIEKSVKAGVMKENPYKSFKTGDFSKENYEKIDIHRPYVDGIILVSENGKQMKRETDIVDVWFDSGAMPYAQWHYPFENKEKFDALHPADFIAEGVDQTRGWFFTLHAVSTMISDCVAFKNIISNGLLQDKFGQKMSKRLGNAIDPFEAIEKYGSDPLRWYMMTNAQPWDNMKFDIDGVVESQRKFFGTLYNTYNFFALYANVDGFNYSEVEIPMNERPEIDRWIISLLNTLIIEVEKNYENYEPTQAGRLISDFVQDNLSNWYVRLNRKRFWGGEKNKDKVAAYQTLYQCLETVMILASPIAPFITDHLYRDLNAVSKKHSSESIHLGEFPKANITLIDKDLEERMDIAQKASSLVLSLRRKENLKVRQPLTKLMVPVLSEKFEKQVIAVKDIILTEVNVKSLEILKDTTGILVKNIKPNFKLLGKKYGQKMKALSALIIEFSQQDINEIEKNTKKIMTLEGENIELLLEEVEISSQDIPGWIVATEDNITVALDITVTEELKQEGIARELVNRIQNIRKESNFEVTDKVLIEIEKNDYVNKAVEIHSQYIASQTLAIDVILKDTVNNSKSIEIEENVVIKIAVNKM